MSRHMYGFEMDPLEEESVTLFEENDHLSLFALVLMGTNAEIDPADRKEIVNHLWACRRCQAEFDDLRNNMRELPKNEYEIN